MRTNRTKALPLPILEQVRREYGRDGATAAIQRVGSAVTGQNVYEDVTRTMAGQCTAQGQVLDIRT